jgi:hypothetical protein
MTQAVECLCSKCKVLNSNPSTFKNKNKEDVVQSLRYV